jgi:carboxylesterase type B
MGNIPFDKRPFQKENQDEDCLFLNVVVPRKIFNEREKKQYPVVIWIHGGGFVQGNKDTLYNPGGLLDRSRDDGGEGIVFVSINYRVYLTFPLQINLVSVLWC